MNNFIKTRSLPKKYRLHQAEEFTEVIRFQYQSSGNFVQIYAKPNELTYSRLGLIIAKRVERLAVKRNRTKRILRETFRMMHGDEKITNMDWVIRLRHPVTRSNSLQLRNEVKSLIFQLQQCHG